MGTVCLKGGSGRKKLKDEPSSSSEPPKKAESTNEAEVPAKAVAGEDLQQAAKPDVLSRDSKTSRSSGEETTAASASSCSSSSGSTAGLPTQPGSAVVPGCRPDAASPVSPASPASPSCGSPRSTRDGSRPFGYDSEGNFSSGAISTDGSDSAKASQSQKLSRHLDAKGSKGSATSSTVDAQTAIKLRKYAKRNRPSRDKFNSQPATSCSTSGRSAPTSSEPSLAVTPEGDRADEEHNAVRLDQKMVKYDIFDDIDADRLKEFDEMLATVMKNSNYEAHKKKKDRNKFSTASHVSSDEETGKTSIT